MSATPDRTPQVRVAELLTAADALVAALQRLQLDPTPGRAEAIAAHLHAMHRAAGILAIALGELIAGEVA
jgi:hypothetical protein